MLGALRMLLLLLSLGLWSALWAQGPLLVPARPEQLLGSWHIKQWTGNMPIPQQKRMHPLPPFSFVKSDHHAVEFQMHILKRIGCRLFRMVFEEINQPGMYLGLWKHPIFLWFITTEGHGIAYFNETLNTRDFQMMMLFGRTADKDSGAERIFREFVESRKLPTTDINSPPQVDACQLDEEP